jgi:hypothetical protein
MPGAPFELSAPLPWKPALRRAVSVGFAPHDDHIPVFLEKHALPSAHQNVTFKIRESEKHSGSDPPLSPSRVLELPAANRLPCRDLFPLPAFLLTAAV